MNKQDKNVREHILNDCINNTQESKAIVLEIPREELTFSTRMLRFFYENKGKDIQDKIPTISKMIYEEIFDKLTIKDSDSEIYKEIKDLVDLFHPACSQDRAKWILDQHGHEGELGYNYLRCEGRFSPNTHIISYYKGNEGDADKDLQPVELPYFDENYIRCPWCKKQNVVIQKNNKDEEGALCMDCKQVAQYRKEDIYWCLGAKCDSPCVFNSKKPTDLSELTINHVIEDVDDISFLASWFNRILGLLPHCYCNSCKHVLLPDYDKADQTRPTVYRATYFSCANKDCSEKGNSIYLNHCSNRKCRVPIDSRLCKQRCENGFSICQHCYACCNQRIFDMKGIKKTGHQEGNEIFCPECGDGLMLSLYGENDFFCRKCKSKRSIKLAHISWRKWPELQKRFDIKFHKNVIKSLFKGTWN